MHHIVQTQCRHGTMVHFAEDTTIGQSLTQYGEWAEYEIAFLSKLINPGATALDIGANIGCHSVAFSKIVGPTGHVYSVEPFADNYALLNLNTRSCGNVTALQALAGVCDRVLVADLKQLTIPDMNMGAISFAKAARSCADRFDGPILVIPQVRLDMFSRLPIALIKIDVEGMEFDVLVGAREMLTTRRPIIYFEQNGPATFPPIASLLFAMDYELFWHPCYPFNTSNFFGNPNNMFGAAIELNVLGVHRSTFASWPELYDRIVHDVTKIRSTTFNPPNVENAIQGSSVPRWEPSLATARS